MYRYLKRLVIVITFQKSKESSDEIINPLATSYNSVAPSLIYIGTKTRVKFDGSCLKQNKITFMHGKTVNIYTVFEINFWDRGYDGYPTLEKILFLTVTLVSNVDIGKSK